MSVETLRSHSRSLHREALAAAADHAVWVDRHGPASWDPYDLWATRPGQWARRLYYDESRFGTVAAAPFVLAETLMPVMRVAFCYRQRYPIADAHYVLGLCELGRLNPARAQGLVAPFVNALLDDRCRDEEEYCWGYPFTWVNCVGTWPAGTPFITSTPYVYEALAAADRLSGGEEFTGILRSIARFARERIGSIEVAPGVKASTYSPIDKRRVVNASAYRGFLLADAGRRFVEAEWSAEALANLRFVMSAQRDDGSWYYAEDGRDRFIDCLHTCMVLKNLIKAARALDDEEQRAAIAVTVDRGWAYFRQHLLDDEGLPRPFARQPRLQLHRRDLYDYAESLNLALLMAGWYGIGTASGREALEIADGIVTDLLGRWRRPDGSFITRELVISRSTVPYVRWAQSQVFRALCVYALMGA